MGALDKTQSVVLQAADPIIGIRVALNPIVRRRDDGREELLGEIAAKVFEIPWQWEFVRMLELRWKGLKQSGNLELEYGPDFDFVPTADNEVKAK